MDKFLLKSKTSKRSHDETEPSGSDQPQNKSNKPSTSKQNPTEKAKPVASEKTVRKWMRDLNIDLDLKSDKGTVSEMSCTVCKHYAPLGMTSNFISGNSTIKRESVAYHVKSEMHIRTIGAKAAAERQQKNQPTDIEKGLKNIEIQESDKLNKLFKTAYYLAIHERPFTDFPNLLDLQESNGVILGDTYRNDKSAKIFIKNIGGIYFDQVKTLIQNEDYFSIFCDGTTDRADKEKEVILVKVLDNFYPKMKYLKLQEPENTKADGILAAIDQAFFEVELQNYKQKTVGFCSDGASVMMGSRRGVIQLMKQQGNADWIMPVWCLAHRLELAMKDAFKSTYMDNVVEIMESVYYFYKGSAKRFKEAKDIAELLGEHFLKPHKANGTRWVDHKLQAVSKLIRSWHIIVAQMENYAEDNSNRAQDRAKAQGYLRKLKQHKLIWYMGFIKDILNEVAKISLIFQREDITVSSAVTKLQSAETALRLMMDNEGDSLIEIKAEIVDGVFRGHTLQNIVPDGPLSEDRRRILQSVLDCINSRLENLTSDPILTACYAFDHKNWPLPADRDALQQYGKEDVRLVFRKYETILTNSGCNLVDALSQWGDLKFHVANTARYNQLHPLLVWQLVSQMDKDKGDFKDILKIIHLTSVLPLSNASCERAFSFLKQIKTDWRCALSASMLDTLMRIKITDISQKDFDPKPAVYRWWYSGEKKKRPTVEPYGQRR